MREGQAPAPPGVSRLWLLHAPPCPEEKGPLRFLSSLAGCSGHCSTQGLCPRVPTRPCPAARRAQPAVLPPEEAPSPRAQCAVQVLPCPHAVPPPCTAAATRQGALRATHCAERFRIRDLISRSQHPYRAGITIISTLRMRNVGLRGCCPESNGSEWP